MSVTYHIEGKRVSPKYIREVYIRNFLDARDIFSKYLGVHLNLRLKRPRITILPHSGGIETRYVKGFQKLLKIQANQYLSVSTKIKLMHGLKEISLEDILKSYPAHEYAEMTFVITRAKRIEKISEIKNVYVRIFYRFLSELFAEIFRSLYCDVKGLEFKPIPRGRWFRKAKIKVKPMYKLASMISDTHKKDSVEFKSRVLQALLFQKLDNLDKLAKCGKNEWESFLFKCLKNEWDKANEHAERRTPIDRWYE